MIVHTLLPSIYQSLKGYFLSGTVNSSFICGYSQRSFTNTKDYIARAFGKEENPDFEAYEAFLESRCFPRSRDKMKLTLRELDLPFYEPLIV